MKIKRPSCYMCNAIAGLFITALQHKDARSIPPILWCPTERRLALRRLWRDGDQCQDFNNDKDSWRPAGGVASYLPLRWTHFFFLSMGFCKTNWFVLHRVSYGITWQKFNLCKIYKNVSACGTKDKVSWTQITTNSTRGADVSFFFFNLERLNCY